MQETHDHNQNTALSTRTEWHHDDSVPETTNHQNNNGNQAGEGFEYHLLAIAIAVALIIQGGGKWATDSLLARKLSGSRER